jgi:plasmid stability protein
VKCRLCQAHIAEQELTRHHSGVILVRTMNLTIKDLPATLHRKLKVRADANNRSLNWEVIDILGRTLEGQPVDMEALLAEVAQVRRRVAGPALTNELLRTAKGEGRP